MSSKNRAARNLKIWVFNWLTDLESCFGLVFFSSSKLSLEPDKYNPLLS
jgi:hypothetical protein